MKVTIIATRLLRSLSSGGCSYTAGSTDGIGGGPGVAPGGGDCRGESLIGSNYGEAGFAVVIELRRSVSWAS